MSDLKIKYRVDYFGGTGWIHTQEWDNEVIAQNAKDRLVKQYPQFPWRIVKLEITVIEESPDV